MKFVHLFVLLIGSGISFTASAQISTDCNSTSYADIESSCGWIYTGGATDTPNASNRGRRATQAEWNSCTDGYRRAIRCDESKLTFRPGSGPGGQLSPANIKEVLARECAAELASLETRVSEFGERGPTHKEWNKCLKTKGLYGIFTDYKNLDFFKRYNKKNKKVRKKFCDTFQKTYKLSPAAQSERDNMPAASRQSNAMHLKFCKETVSTGLSIDKDDEFAYHYPFSQFAEGAVCTYDRGERLQLCATMFDAWSPAASEKTALQAQCNRYTEWDYAKGENGPGACSKTIKFSGQTWAQFEAKIKEKQKKYCDEKLNAAMYALIMNEFETLAFDGVVIDLSNPEGIWKSLDFSGVPANYNSDVTAKLRSIKEKITKWIKDHPVFEGCKGYDSLNILAVIARDRFSPSQSTPVGARDHGRNHAPEAGDIDPPSDAPAGNSTEH